MGGASGPAEAEDGRRFRRRGVRFDRLAHRERNLIERLINRRKQHRAIAVRSEKLAGRCHAMGAVAATLLWVSSSQTRPRSFAGDRMVLALVVVERLFHALSGEPRGGQRGE